MLVNRLFALHFNKDMERSENSTAHSILYYDRDMFIYPVSSQQ